MIIKPHFQLYRDLFEIFQRSFLVFNFIKYLNLYLKNILILFGIILKLCGGRYLLIFKIVNLINRLNANLHKI